MKKQTWSARNPWGIVRVVAIATVIAWHGQATAQQPNTDKPAPASQSADNTPTRTLPINGKGTINTIPVFTGTYLIGNSLITQSGGTVNVSGAVSARSFTGDGTSLTNVNAATLQGLTSSAFAQTNAANTFTTDQTINGNLNFSGAANSTLILQGNLFDANGEQSANIIGGYPGNVVDPGVIGATIGGGGGLFDSASVRPRAKGSVQLQRRGAQNGRPLNVGNKEDVNTPGLVLMSNHISGNAGTIAGGLNNFTQLAGGTIGGGANNYAGFYGTVAGGNTNSAGGEYSSVGGGQSNKASGNWSSVGDGQSNTASGQGSTVGGGLSNLASCTDQGNGFCTIPGFGGASTVAGGSTNAATGPWDTVAGGSLNIASGNDSGGSTVGGGTQNTASGDNATVPGGAVNTAAGGYSFAAGVGQPPTTSVASCGPTAPLVSVPTWFRTLALISS
jgi:hypothetical protein